MRPPLPGDVLFPDHERCIVIASVMFRDEEDTPEEWTVLLLRPKVPYFMVATVDLGWSITAATAPIENIVPAVDEYKNWGGDY